MSVFVSVALEHYISPLIKLWTFLTPHPSTHLSPYLYPTQSLGQHDHSHSEQSEESKEPVDLLVDFDGVWKGLTALAGIYLLFIIEHCIGMFKHFKDQGVRCQRRW